jgi:AcrR family transcriptional regulator
MAGSTRRRTPTAAVGQALVDAAERVLEREGPDAVTVRAVSAQAGVAPMGVYNHLGGKQGLMRALLSRGFAALQAELLRVEGPDPVTRLREAGKAYRRFALAHPRQYELMFDKASWPQQPEGEPAQVDPGAFEALVDHIQAGIGAGLLRPADPYASALQTWCCVHGAVSLELRGLIDAAGADEAYEGLLDFILRGLASTK